MLASWLAATAGCSGAGPPAAPTSPGAVEPPPPPPALRRDVVEFELDKAVIRPQSYPVVHALAQAARGASGPLVVRVHGRAPAPDAEVVQTDLVELRARALRQALIEAHGVAPATLEAWGCRGTTCPRVDEPGRHVVELVPSVSARPAGDCRCWVAR